VTATEAALTAPASYDASYQYDVTYGGFLAAGAKGTQGSSVYFSRSGTSPFNYTFTGDANKWPFDITMTFNKSNTVWSVGPTASDYEPDDTKIGSTNAVGTVFPKILFELNNQTSNNYKFILDISSTGGNRDYLLTYGSTTIGYLDIYNVVTHGSLTSFFVPAYTTFKIQLPSQSSANYFDAWYLQDLGMSSAFENGFDVGNETGYDEGYLEGYDDGYGNSASPLWDGLEVVVGVTVNFILFIMTLSIFDISLLSVGIVLISILGIIWVLKAFRG
jgi:hypothetical protein